MSDWWKRRTPLERVLYRWLKPAHPAYWSPYGAPMSDCYLSNHGALIDVRPIS